MANFEINSFTVTITSAASVCREALSAYEKLTPQAKSDISGSINADLNVGIPDLISSTLEFIKSLSRSYAHSAAHASDLEPLRTIYRHQSVEKRNLYINCVINEVLKEVKDEP